MNKTKICNCNHCKDGEIWGGLDLNGLDIFIKGWCTKCGYKITERARRYYWGKRPITDFYIIMKKFNKRIGV